MDAQKASDAGLAGAWDGPPSGLVWEFRFTDGVGVAVGVEGPADVADWTWAHFRLGDMRAQGVLSHIELPAAAHELFALHGERVQVEAEDGWVFGVLPDLERDLAGQPQGAGRLVFAFAEGRLITGRLHALRAVDDLRRQVEAGVAFASPAAALTELVELYLDRMGARFAEAGDKLAEIEDYILTEPRDPRDCGLAALRRSLSRQRRELQALKSALGRALGGRQGLRVEALAEVLPELLAMIEDLDHEAASLQDRSRLLYEEVDTLINAATNRSMRTLTVLSTLLIPPTVIVGAFGMNVPGIPWDKSPIGFSLACGLCVLSVGGSVWLLRRMEMLP
jgi:zinc transporter